MAGRKDATVADSGATQKPDRDGLSDKQLARAILAREFRPRAAEVLRLAEAVLRKSAARKGKKAKNAKLAKIPQKKK